MHYPETKGCMIEKVCMVVKEPYRTFFKNRSLLKSYPVSIFLTINYSIIKEWPLALYDIWPQKKPFKILWNKHYTGKNYVRSWNNFISLNKRKIETISLSCCLSLFEISSLNWFLSEVFWTWEYTSLKILSIGSCGFF